MRLLLDECVPRKLARELPGHEVNHVTQVGWAGARNGRLLALMQESGYSGLVTTDKNLASQQDLQGSRVFVILLLAKSNSPRDLRPLAPEILRAVEFARPGQVVRVGA